ncbi:MAG: 3-deoxy-7-phosphoheptulonate synthase [Pseudomonadales bacterium]|nr:3-deoxy-7-phosphoheptulonate synthase [Pseudomonadales bacterium]
MKYNTDDIRITGMEEVIAPEALSSELPITDSQSHLIFQSRQDIAKIVHGQDPRLFVLVGPCSIHDTDAALEYADRLSPLVERYADSLLIAMRVYFEKPRTTVGWKGLINDPNMDNSYDINLGLRKARGLLGAILDKGLATGTEFLDPISPQYYADLVSWGAIGARTTESQVHRQLASGLSCPIGFKNSTDGSIQVAVDAVKSASHPHMFLSVTKQGRSAIFETAGNKDCHVILRGGGGKTNFDNASIHYASRILENADTHPSVMIDVSHANSSKQFKQQIKVCDDLCKQLKNGEKRISGVMIESNLIEGNQSVSADPLIYGKSVTDACINWKDTETCLEQLAEATLLRNQAA